MSLATRTRGWDHGWKGAQTRPRWLVAWVALTAVVAFDVAVWEADASATLRVPEDHPTIQAAIQAAADGDVIDVAPGTYAGPITVDRSVTIVGRDHDPADPRNDTTVLDGGGSTVVTVARGLVPGPSFVGLSFRNGNDGLSARSPIALEHSHFTGNVDHIDFTGASGGIVRNNVFELSGDDAIDVDHPMADLLVEGNHILTASDDGIEIRLHDDPLVDPVEIVIRGNRIVGSRRDGIQVIDYYQDPPRSITIERNLILDVGMAAIGLMDDAISNEDFRAASIRERIGVFHNTIVGADHGISGGDNLIAVGNILQGQVVGMKNVDGGSIASHNLFFGNQTDAIGSVVDETATVRADPLLDAEHGLSSGSPAIDAGTASFEWGGEVVLTIPEYEGLAPDLGWIERQGDGSNAPPVGRRCSASPMRGPETFQPSVNDPMMASASAR